MIRYLACDIKEKMLSTGYIREHYEYAAIKKDGDVTYPMQYIGNGKYLDIFNIDVNGHSYLRKSGKVSISPAASKNNVKYKSCGGDENVEIRFPFRLVLTVPRTMLGDDAFSDDYLADEIIEVLSADIDIPEIDSREIEYVINDYDTDAISVWNAEVTGSKHQMNFKYSYIAVNFTAKIIINPSCFINGCSYR